MKRQEPFLVVLLLLNTTLFSQTNFEFDKEAITKTLYQYVNDSTPGLAVGIVKNGKVVYEHYLGCANLNHEIKINKDTRFNIASNAKQFTAIAILKLIEEEKINLDDDFRKYLPDLYPDIKDKITISNLLTHTSGVRDYCDLMSLQGKTWWKQFIDNRDAIELLVRQNDLNFQPGTEYLYSNSNYILLAEIIKVVTGQEFGVFTKTMFQELSMPNTGFLTNYMAVIPNKARPYGNWNGWREIPVITEVHGDGALFTTLQDQLKWEQIVQINNGKHLSQKLINRSQQPLKISTNNDYGYGLEFDTYGGLNRKYHNGATGGYRATFWRFPTEKISFVIMTNNRRVPIDYLTWQIVDLVMDLQKKNENIIYPENPIKIEKLKNIQDILGIYQGKDGTVIKIVENEGLIYREIYQRNPVKLINEKGGLFKYETIKGLKINFTQIGKKDQRLTLYKSSQKPSSYYKISNLDMNKFDKSQLNGRFYNDETNTEITINHKGGNNYSLTKNGQKRNAELIFPDYLRMMEVYKIKIIRDNEQNVSGLSLERDRIKNIIFTKKKND